MLPTYMTVCLATAPLSVGLPILFFRWWLSAARAAGTGGGMFYAPSTAAETVFELGYLSTAFPFIVSMLVLMFAMGGVAMAVETILPGSVALDDLAYPHPVFLALIGISVVIQVLTWAAPAYWAWTRLTGTRQSSRRD